MLVHEPDEGVPAIIRALVQAGASIREVFDDERPLEDVYFKLMSADTEPVP
jgi:hypothetical protein